MKLPKKIRLGANDFDVSIVSGLTKESDALDGSINHGELTLKVEKKLVDHVQFQTIWHEVLHSLLIQMGHQKDLLDESHIDSLAYGIVQVLRDNPVLRTPPQAAKRTV